MEAVKIKFNRFLIFFLISILVFNSISFNVSAQSDSFYIGDFSSDAPPETHVSSNNFVVDSNGYYYILVFNDTTPYNFTFYKSINEGNTWASSVEFDMSYDENQQPDNVAICINDNNIIHIAYTYGDGAYEYNISYRQYNPSSDIISAKVFIHHQSNTGQQRSITGLSISSNDNGEVIIFYNEYFNGASDANELYCKVYNDQTLIWGDEFQIFRNTSSGPIHGHGLSSDVLDNGTFVYSFTQYEQGDENIFIIGFFDDETEAYDYYHTKVNSDSASAVLTDIAVDNNNNIHTVNEWGNSINYTFYDISTDTAYTETLPEQTESQNPQIAINSDNTVQVVFIGDNGGTPSDWVLGYYGSYNDWSSLQIYQSGVSDNMNCVFIPYQHLQSFTHLTDGVIGYCVNDTNKHAYHFDEGYELFYDAAGGGTGDGSGTIYIYFFDRTTSDYFASFNLPFGTSYLSGSLSSDMNDDNIYTTGTQFPLSITTYFNNGEYHYINLTNPTSYGMGVGYKAYYDFSTYIQIYHGQTYAFGLTPVGYSDPFYNTNCKWRTDWWIFTGWEACIATDKEYYTSGETVDLFYKMPTVQQLVDAGYDSTNWRVGIWNYQNVTDIGGLIFAYEDGLEFTSAALTFSDQWEADGNYDPPTPSSGTDIYIAAIYKPGGIFGNVDFIFWDLYLKFYITEGSFTPSGNITAISPSEPEIGQNVNISFEANNNGRLTYKNLLDAGGENDITIFDKFTGTEYANRRFYEYGVYELNLYVSDGAFYTLVDTDYFYINTSNATGPGEYLTVRPYYAIAGFDTIFITYKTEVDGTLIDVVDALGQTTAYGTTVDTGGGTYTFDLPTGAPIGTWYVTMYGNDTLTANFTVIADENNYFRFSKNQYYNDEHFALVLNHDKRIAITFYKDGVPQGSDLVFAANQQAQGLYVVPFDIVTPSVGDWYAEMYEINNNIHIRLLAADNCTVINKPTPDIEGGYDNILGMLVMAGDVFGGGALGLMVMSIFILIVIAVLLAKFKMDNSTILFISIIAALALSVIGWLPWWITVIAIILTGLLFGEAFSKKLNLGGK